MFIKNVHGQEAINTLAQRIGCIAGEAMPSRFNKSTYGRPGLIGNTFAIKDTLKEHGARWDGENKAWVFESWAALEAALTAIIAQ